MNAQAAAVCMFTDVAADWVPDQARAEELAAHEARLGDWKRRFKAEAARAIGAREDALAQWQAQLQARKAELEELKASVEVGKMPNLAHPQPLSPTVPGPEDSEVAWGQTHVAFCI